MAQDNKNESGAQQSLNQSSGVDERLLSRTVKKKEKKEKQRQAQEQSDISQAPRSYREEIAEARRQKAIKEKKKARAKGKTPINPIRKGSSGLLRQAWLHIIDSFGLTIIWIDIHVFLGIVFGEKFFCKLGAEWMDRNIKTAQFERAKRIGGVAGQVEGMGLACLNLGCLLLLLIVFSIIAMIVTAITNPLDAIGTLFGIIWDAVTG